MARSSGVVVGPHRYLFEIMIAPRGAVCPRVPLFLPPNNEQALRRDRNYNLQQFKIADFTDPPSGSHFGAEKFERSEIITLSRAVMFLLFLAIFILIVTLIVFSYETIRFCDILFTRTIRELFFFRS
jgi:hypothetical protein